MQYNIAATTNASYALLICFQLAEGCIAAELHQRMSKVNGENFMSDGSVCKWSRKFKEGRTDTYENEDRGLSLSPL